jgi:bacterioferritin
LAPFFWRWEWDCLSFSFIIYINNLQQFFLTFSSPKAKLAQIQLNHFKTVIRGLFMKSDATVIKHLNKALGNELIAINQYFLHSRMYQDWGLEKLAAKEYEESIDEMKHADLLMQRILFLEGLPNVQNLGKLMIGENTKEMLECDLKLEFIACPDLKEGIAYCESISDFVSRDLLSEILSSEEEHIDFLKTQLTLIEKVGLENYQQSMI